MNAVARLGLAVSTFFRRTIPDPFILAILLSLFTAAFALTAGFPPPAGSGRVESRAEAIFRLFDAWRGDSGLWKLLSFAMQMCLVLVSGHALASAAPIRRVLERLADVPRSTRSAAAIVGLTC